MMSLYFAVNMFAIVRTTGILVNDLPEWHTVCARDEGIYGEPEPVDAEGPVVARRYGVA